MLEVMTVGKNGVLKGRISPRTMEIIRNMPGRRRYRDGDLWFELTGANLECLKSQLPPDTKWSEDLLIVLANIGNIRTMEADAQADKVRPLPPEAANDFRFKSKPFDHQLRAFLMSRDREAFGYFMEMGTGKSKVLIDVICWLYSHGKIDAALIAAPNGVHRQWINEQLRDHVPDHIEYEATYYESGASQKQKDKINEVYRASGKLRIIAINVEALSHKSGMTFAQNFLSGSRAMFAIDESSRIKSASSIRTKNCLALAKLAKYRRILSGTPVTNGPEDLYSQFLFLHPNILGFNSFYTFRNRYCVTQQIPGAPSGAVRIVSYQNLDELQKRLDGHSFRVLKEDCLDLPQKTFTCREVEFDPEQKKLYLQLRDEFLVQLDSGHILDAPLAVTRLMRLQQILCGHLRVKAEDGDKSPWVPVPTKRLDVLMDCIEEAAGAKTIVWARFEPDIKQIANRLKDAGIGFVEYYGATTQEERIAAIELFRNDPDCTVFLSNPAAGGIGLNLTVSANMIWYSCDFDLEKYLQANDRIHRIGQEKPVTYIHLVTTGSLDQKVYLALKNKKTMADTLLDIRDMLV